MVCEIPDEELSSLMIEHIVSAVVDVDDDSHERVPSRDNDVADVKRLADIDDVSSIDDDVIRMWLTEEGGDDLTVFVLEHLRCFIWLA